MANVTALGMMTIFGYPNFPIGGLPGLMPRVFLVEFSSRQLYSWTSRLRISPTERREESIARPQILACISDFGK